MYSILTYLTLISFFGHHVKESHCKWMNLTCISYHKFDHDDFGSNFLEHEEGLHEAQVVTQQCQAVEHSCPHELAIVESEPQDDWQHKHNVHNQLEYVPWACKIPRYFVFKRVCFFWPNLQQKCFFILNTKIYLFVIFLLFFIIISIIIIILGWFQLNTFKFHFSICHTFLTQNNSKLDCKYKSIS